MVNQFKTLLVLVSLAAFTASAPAAAQGLNITMGAQWIMTGNVHTVVQDGGINNNGTFNTGSGTVDFKGNAATTSTTISGKNSFTFYNLTLNKTANGLMLYKNINVTNNLNLLGGDSIYLNGYVIDLGTTGSLQSEATARRITGIEGGYIQRTIDLNAPSAVNPGNIGVEITSAANLGTTVIKRGHTQQPGGSIFRYFDIQPTNNSGLNATISFHYQDSELAGIPETNLMLFSSLDAGSHWSMLGRDGNDETLNFVSKGGLNQLNMYTLADMGTILPVHLLYFNGKAYNRQVQLKWALAYESNIQEYVVERSTDGIHFNDLLTIHGRGNSSNTIYYDCVDPNPVIGINYYRLRIVDVIEAVIYSKTIPVKVDLAANETMSIYPNPAQDFLKLVMPATTAADYRIDLFNMNGKIVQTRTGKLMPGLNELSWDIRSLPAGMYTVRVTGAFTKSMPFIKQ